MKFCTKCGGKLEDSERFCPACGAPAASTVSEAQANPNYSTGAARVSAPTDTTSQYDKEDIKDHKAISVLSYFGPLFFVPLIATPNSKFARYHANQGLVLFVLEFVYGIFYSLLIEFFGVIFPMQITLGGYGRSIAYSVLVVLFGLVWIFLLVITILGIVNAAKGRAKELPIFGKFRFFK